MTIKQESQKMRTENIKNLHQWSTQKQKMTFAGHVLRGSSGDASKGREKEGKSIERTTAM